MAEQVRGLPMPRAEVVSAAAGAARGAVVAPRVPPPQLPPPRPLNEPAAAGFSGAHALALLYAYVTTTVAQRRAMRREEELLRGARKPRRVPAARSKPGRRE